MYNNIFLIAIVGHGKVLISHKNISNQQQCRTVLWQIYLIKKMLVEQVGFIRHAFVVTVGGLYSDPTTPTALLTYGCCDGL